MSSVDSDLFLNKWRDKTRSRLHLDVCKWSIYVEAAFTEQLNYDLKNTKQWETKITWSKEYKTMRNQD